MQFNLKQINGNEHLVGGVVMKGGSGCMHSAGGDYPTIIGHVWEWGKRQERTLKWAPPTPILSLVSGKLWMVSILRCIVFMGASQLWEESVEGATDSGEWMSGYSTASSLKDLVEITIGYLARCYLIGVYTEKYLVWQAAWGKSQLMLVLVECWVTRWVTT